MRPNDPDFETTVLHPREVTLAEGEIHVVITTRPPTVIFVAKWVEISYAVLNVCVTASDLKVSIRQCIPERNGRAALLHIFVASEIE